MVWRRPHQELHRIAVLLGIDATKEIDVSPVIAREELLGPLDGDLGMLVDYRCVALHPSPNVAREHSGREKYLDDKICRGRLEWQARLP